MIVLNICLSDLPKEAIHEGKNGKKYINLVCDERKEVGQYGDTHSISLSQSKEERQIKTPKVYVGSGKEFIFENKRQPQSNGRSDGPDLPY